MNKKLFYSFFIFISILFLVVGNLSIAQECSTSCATGDTNCTVCLTNPLGTESPQILIGRIINGVLGIVGSIALVMFIYGGFTWMTSSGNMEKVTKGKNILIWAVIGLVVIFASYALVNFVIFEAIQPTPAPAP